MKKSVIRTVCYIIAVVALIVMVSGCLLSQPTWRHNQPSLLSVAPDRLHSHVLMLSETFYPRDWQNTANLSNCVQYITSHFKESGAVVSIQPVPVQGHEYQNVIARFGVGLGSKIVIGAHYDACGDTPGADDNASGIAALLELADLFVKNPPQRETELVAYALEEPPFFRTPLMGSAVHAATIAAETNKIAGVIVFDMIGYFSDERGSQAFPIGLLRAIYPSRGNFIAVVGRWDQGRWIKKIKTGMKGVTDLPAYSIRAPASLPGVDMSDHLNYWTHGINAVMITDTAFLRNRAYHQRNDTADSLDYDKMAKVVIAVYEAIKTL